MAELNTKQTIAKYFLATALLMAVSAPLWFPGVPPEIELNDRFAQRSVAVGEAVTAEERRVIEKRVAGLWNRFVDRIPDLERAQLNPGATEEELERLENVVGVKLPPDFRAFLKLCNGVGYQSCLYPGPLSTSKMAGPDYSYADRFKYRPVMAAKSFHIPDDPRAERDETRVHLDEGHPGFMIISDSGDEFGYAIELSSGKILTFDFIDSPVICHYVFENYEKYLEFAAGCEFEKNGGVFLWRLPCE